MTRKWLNTERQREIAFYLAVCVLCCLTFIKAFKAGYVDWDDDNFIRNNEILKMPFWDAVKASFGNVFFYDYVPLPLMTYWTEVNLFGFNPAVQHTLNAILHLANIGLLNLFLIRVNLARKFRWPIVFLFAVHPAQTEVMMWVSNRNLFLSVFFILLSCLYSRKSLESRGRLNYVLTFLFYVASLCSKATGLLLPFFFVALDHATLSARWKAAFKRYVPFFIVFLIGGYVRSYADSYGSGGIFLQRAFDAERVFQLPVAVFNAIAVYLKMLFVPVGYSIIYQPFSISWQAGLRAAGAAALCAGIILAWKQKKRWEYVFFGAIIAVFLFPVLQIVPRLSYVNDRYLYVPIIGFAGLFLVALEDAGVPAKAKWLGFAVLAALPFFSFQRSLAWESNLTLWQDTAAKNPQSAVALSNLAIAYQKEHDIDKAIDYFKRALAAPVQDSSPGLILNDLGAIFSNQELGRYDLRASAGYFQQAVEKSTSLEDSFIPRLNLANVTAKLGDKNTAVAILTKLQDDLSTRMGDQENLYLMRLAQSQLSKLKGQ